MNDTQPTGADTGITKQKANAMQNVMDNKMSDEEWEQLVDDAKKVVLEAILETPGIDAIRIVRTSMDASVAGAPLDSAICAALEELEADGRISMSGGNPANRYYPFNVATVEAAVQRASGFDDPEIEEIFLAGEEDDLTVCARLSVEVRLEELCAVDRDLWVEQRATLSMETFERYWEEAEQS